MNVNFNNGPHQTTTKGGSGGNGRPPGARFVDAPPPSEEPRLNFELRNLLDYAERIMHPAETEKADGPKKWKGINGLMRLMREKFPYLITADTSLELCFEDELFGETYEFQGPLSYQQFIDALGTKGKMDDYHDYIVKNYAPIGKGDKQRETLKAEDKLLMLYSALRYELEHHEGFDDLFVDEEAPAPQEQEQEERMIHFGLKSSGRDQEHYESVYNCLVNRGWLWRNEVSSHGWVHACCGEQEARKDRIVWHGSKAALAHIVRKHFKGQWNNAKKIFCLADGEKFPQNFHTSHKPKDDITEFIDRIF